MNKIVVINIDISLDKIEIKRIKKYPGRPTIIFLHDSLGCVKLWSDFPHELGNLTKFTNGDLWMTTYGGGVYKSNGKTFEKFEPHK